MNILLRLVAASGLAGLALAAPVAAQDLLAPQTVTGSYLAGQQAMSELRTPEAAQFFRAAAADEWDNPLVLG
ncbi:MAG: hypothetical protein Q7T08_13230, partial [Devosia sp.]|nr:hypothetical protein [Devosia sp.]